MYAADEMFMTGTAAEIMPVTSVDDILIGSGARGPITQRLQDTFFGLFSGATEDKWGWLDELQTDTVESTNAAPIAV